MRSLILLNNIILIYLIFCKLYGCQVLGVLHLRATSGRDAILPCGPKDPIADGTAGYVTWFKMGRSAYHWPIAKTRTRYGNKDPVWEPTCKTTYCPNISGLFLKEVTTQDAGAYRCRLYHDNVSAGEYFVKLSVVEPTAAPTVYHYYGNNVENVKLGFVGPLSIGSNVTLVCQVAPVGNTTTILYWVREGQKLKYAADPKFGLMQVNLHLFNITRADMNVLYQCATQNADVSEPLVTNVKIKMFTPPLSVEIRMDGNYNLEVDYPRVVDCVVLGCMPPPQIEWLIGTVPAKPNVHKELHDGNYTISSLTLLPSKKQDGKDLICRVRNSFYPDLIFQDKVTLKVGFRPICKSQTVKIGIVTKEIETVACVVEADPAPEAILWTFANSIIMQSRIEKVTTAPNHYQANLTWLSRIDDIGPLICRAANMYGNQTEPCVFNIYPGGVPEAPNCDLRRSLPDSLQVRCIKGWDGGRPQIIHLDIVAQNGTTIRNLTDAEGMFFLPNVGLYGNMSAIIYAANKRGKSLEKTTLIKSMTANVDAKTGLFSSTWMVFAMTFIILFAGVSVVCTVSICLKIFLSSRAPNPESIELSDGVFHREPDFLRQEQLLEHTRFAILQMEKDLDQYTPVPTPPPPPAFRVVFDDIPSPSREHYSNQSYYV